MPTLKAESGVRALGMLFYDNVCRRMLPARVRPKAAGGSFLIQTPLQSFYVFIFFPYRGRIVPSTPRHRLVALAYLTIVRKQFSLVELHL